MDTEHKHGTFLTEEFGFFPPRRYAALLRILVMGLGMITALLILTGFISDAHWFPGWIAIYCPPLDSL